MINRFKTFKIEFNTENWAPLYILATDLTEAILIAQNRYPEYAKSITVIAV